MAATEGGVITIVWRRLDLPGHDAAALDRDGDDWRIAGVAVLTSDGRPARLDYEVRCDAGWRTRSATIAGWIGEREVRLTLERDAGDRWRVAGAGVPALDGCRDVDLAFTPATNTLPIRRLRLAVGTEAAVRAAWVRFPDLSTEVLEQTYRRTAPDRYHYESAGGAFRRELALSGAGFVTSYPGLWEAEGVGGAHEPFD